ncbi:MAG: FAD-dependent monooxygenase [Terrimicrobiaceae bacterium]
MLAGLLLARAAVPCLILERKDGLSTHPKAMGLTRRTLEIFRSLGLEEAVSQGSLDLSQRDLVIWSKSLVGEELGRVPLAPQFVPESPCPHLHCPQTWTERVLFDALSVEKGVAIRFGCEVQAISDDPQGALRVRLATGETIETEWLIAADGASSGIRRQLDIPTDGPGDMGHFLNIQFRAPLGERIPDRRAVMYNAVGDDFFEAFVAVDGTSRWLMHHFLQPGESPSDFSNDRLAETIRYATGLADLPVEILGVSPWVMSPKVARFWRAGRVLLAGDAAARLSPAGGLGLNTGLQGVQNLAWKLAAVIRGGISDSLLDTYDSERRPVAAQTMGHTNKNAEEIFTVLAAAFRGDWDAAREIISHSRRAGSGLGQDLGTTYERGAFVPDDSAEVKPSDPVNDYIPSARPGRRAPHVGEHGGGSLLDRFGSSFVLMAGSRGESWQHPVDIPLLVSGRDFHAPGFESVYGIGASGAVLIRPDGFVAARWAESPGSTADTVDQVLSQICNGR